MAQMILYLCRETNIKVMNILNEISKTKAEDVTEFITTVQLVQITINGLIKTPKPFKFELLKDLQNSLKDYETLLVQLKGTGSLVRFVTSNRLRRKIEQANSNLHAKLEKFRESIQKDENENANSGPEASNGSKEHTPTAEEENMAEEEAEGALALSLMIQDQDGKEVWAELFGLESFMVEWSRFIAGLRKILTDIEEDEEKVLQYILDNSNTGFINQHKFSEFLKGFGPVQDCVKNVKSIMSAKWFYGFLSRKEAEWLLRDQPVRTFLIRLSSSQPGSFALAFSVEQNGEKSCCHILINSCGLLGYQVQEQENQGYRTFKTLFEIVDYYSVFLEIPFSSPIPFESWFEGDISSQEACAFLTGTKPGTFLVRFSSKIGSYAVSYVSKTGEICHSLVNHDGVQGGGYSLVYEGQALIFNSLKEVVSYYGDALSYPFKLTGNELSVEAVKTITQWKAERAREMEKVDLIVSDLFDTTKELSLPMNISINDSRVDSIVQRLFDAW